MPAKAAPRTVTPRLKSPCAAIVQAIGLEVIPSIQNTRKAFREAREDSERAEAWQALEGGGRSTQSRTAATARRHKATRRQIEAAVAKLNVAQARLDRVRARMRRADVAAERLRTCLRAVLG